MSAALGSGSGIGGLSCASLLAKYGYSVKIFESHYLAGGCCHMFDHKVSLGGATRHGRHSPRSTSLLAPSFTSPHSVPVLATSSPPGGTPSFLEFSGIL